MGSGPAPANATSIPTGNAHARQLSPEQSALDVARGVDQTVDDGAAQEARDQVQHPRPSRIGGANNRTRRDRSRSLPNVFQSARTAAVYGRWTCYKAKLEAANTEGAQAADLAAKPIAAEIEARKSAQAIIIAEQGRWWTAPPRALVQWSFAVFVVKCVIWDTVFGLGTTEPLGGDIQAWAGWVMALWFGGRSLEKIAAVIWRGR